MTGNDIVILGRLADPYGIRGWLKLHPFGDDPLDWDEIPVWWISKDGESWRECGLKGLKVHGNGVVVLLDGIDDRTAAEAMKGVLVGAPRDALPETDEDEFYWADLIGLEVINTADERLGKVVGLLETGAHDVLRVVGDDEVERLLPFVAAVVLTVDKEAQLIRVEWGSDW
ncbi:ribosome maturation factor RimM [Quatrionicoccus australiensis]|uniref:ribosome maturation factor RimM n=1 Tax=Quatrionicoccus australiensis TaxID=138118 RepID=UPI001CF93A06|nr:ribosome maturation factor RimM [Quatrionicoccus australiensis]